MGVISSDGRASPLHGEGQRFDPVITHQPSLANASFGLAGQPNKITYLLVKQGRAKAVAPKPLSAGGLPKYSQHNSLVFSFLRFSRGKYPLLRGGWGRVLLYASELSNYTLPWFRRRAASPHRLRKSSGTSPINGGRRKWEIISSHLATPPPNPYITLTRDVRVYIG